MSTDRMHFEILEDGTVKVTTDGVSGANHFQADEFLKMLDGDLGGEVRIAKRSRLSVGVSLQSAFDAHAHDGHYHTH